MTLCKMLKRALASFYKRQELFLLLHPTSISLSMEASRRFLPAILLLFLLVISSDMGMRAVEARKCESPSHKFKGLCFRASNCANVCKTEGFHGGHCQGFRRRCFCTKHC